jgi:BarA-like signal transduction histidine kinase
MQTRTLQESHNFEDHLQGLVERAALTEAPVLLISSISQLPQWYYHYDVFLILVVITPFENPSLLVHAAQ